MCLVLFTTHYCLFPRMVDHVILLLLISIQTFLLLYMLLIYSYNYLLLLFNLLAFFILLMRVIGDDSETVGRASQSHPISTVTC